MARRLSDIPRGYSIVDKDGKITTFYRLRWQELQDGFLQGATVAGEDLEDQHAAVAAHPLYTTHTRGRYAVSWYLRKLVADGAGSAVQLTIAYLDKGQALTEVGANLATDTSTAHQSGSVLLNCDADSDINISTIYASTTPNAMGYDLSTQVQWFP